jgi:hypothetical protein
MTSSMELPFKRLKPDDRVVLVDGDTRITLQVGAVYGQVVTVITEAGIALNLIGSYEKRDHKPWHEGAFVTEPAILVAMRLGGVWEVRQYWYADVILIPVEEQGE